MSADDRDAPLATNPSRATYLNMERPWRRLTVDAAVRAVERWTKDHFTFVLTAMVMVVLANELMLFGANLRNWDPMYISAALTFVMAIRVALELDGGMGRTLVRLSRRGALSLTAQETGALTECFRARAEVWAKRGGLVLTGLVFLAFGAAFGRGLLEQAWFTIVAVAGGYLAGRSLGRAVAYGTLGVFLRRHGHEPVARPGHLDGAAGLKPVGDFYFFQAMVLAIPAVFLALWWAVIPLLGRYTNWRQPYLALLTVALTGEILAFLVPMWSFHRMMKLQKEICLREADEISREVSDLQLRLMSTEAKEEREAVKQRLSLRMDRYSAIESMPTWPLDSVTRRRFTINNLVLCLPLLSKVLNLPASWKDFLDGIQRILSA